MTSPDYCALVVKAGDDRMRGRNKFHARPTQRGGRLYASRAEADRANDLELLQQAGEIVDLKAQPRIELERGVFYKPDFSYVENGRVVYEDVKGVETERFKLICKIWALHGPGELRIVKRQERRRDFVVVRTILAGIEYTPVARA